MSNSGLKPYMDDQSGSAGFHNSQSLFRNQMATPNRRQGFPYMVESPYRPSDEYQRNRNSRLINSYNVPMKNRQDQYVEVLDRNTNVSPTFILTISYPTIANLKALTIQRDADHV